MHNILIFVNLDFHFEKTVPLLHKLVTSLNSPKSESACLNQITWIGLLWDNHSDTQQLAEGEDQLWLLMRSDLTSVD